MYSGGEAPKATCHSFTLTSIKGDKSYVTCLTMYEVLGDAAGAAQEKHTQYTIGPSLVVPVCYCLMSRVVCTEFSRAWLLRYARAAKAEQPLMVQRVLKCKKKNGTHTHTYTKQTVYFMFMRSCRQVWKEVHRRWRGTAWHPQAQSHGHPFR